MADVTVCCYHKVAILISECEPLLYFVGTTFVFILLEPCLYFVGFQFGCKDMMFCVDVMNSIYYLKRS